MSKIIKTSMKYISFPSIKYISPKIGNSPKGFDCSGFIQWVLLKAGIKIHNVPNTNRCIRHSEEFFDYFGFSVHEKMVRPGDLVFFSKKGIRPTHVGLYLGEGKMIHAGNSTKMVEVIRIKDYIKKRPLRYPKNETRRQNYTKNPIGYKRIAVPKKDRFQKLPIK